MLIRASRCAADDQSTQIGVRMHCLVLQATLSNVKPSGALGLKLAGRNWHVAHARPSGVRMPDRGCNPISYPDHGCSRCMQLSLG